MAGNTNRVLVDASAWIAYFKPDDSHLQRAQELFDRELSTNTTLLTSNLIIYEVLTVLAMRSGKGSAQIFDRWFFDDALKRHLIEYYWVNDLIEYQARQLFHKIEHKNISFTDCSSIIIAQQRSIEHIFTFDRDFQKFEAEFGIHILN